MASLANLNSSSDEGSLSDAAFQLLVYKAPSRTRAEASAHIARTEANRGRLEAYSPRDTLRNNVGRWKKGKTGYTTSKYISVRSITIAWEGMTLGFQVSVSSGISSSLQDTCACTVSL